MSLILYLESLGGKYNNNYSTRRFSGPRNSAGLQSRNIGVINKNMETFLSSLITGGIGGGILTLILRNWITERLKQSIQHEYSHKLETHKSELNVKLQSIIHDKELYNLRTSLFFDHQRKAFAEISSQLAQTKDEWFSIAFDPEESFVEPVPTEQYKTFKRLFYEHQLFFDIECSLVIELALQAMQDSFPFQDTLYGPEEKRECYEAYQRLEYIQERMVQIFQEKLGLSPAISAKRDLAYLTLVILLNRHRHDISELMIEGKVPLSSLEIHTDAVEIVKKYKEAILKKSEELKKCLANQLRFEPDLQKADTAINILKEI